MAFQGGKDMVVAFKVEGTFNTAPGSGSAEQLRLKASPGLSLVKQLINSEEVRSDGQTTIARHGSRNVTGSYNIEVSVDSYDTVLEALMRSTWVAAAATTFNNGAPLTSLTVDSTSQITWTGSTTPLAAGLREGDVFRLTNMSTAANNSINIRVKTISGGTITVHGTPLTAQAADIACTLTILRKLSATTTPTRRTFYIDEYGVGTDLSVVYGGCRVVGFSLRGTPDGMAEGSITVLGASATALATGTSPYYVAPTVTTTLPLVFADATFSYNGTDVATCTAWELNYEITAATQPVIGATVTPDVFDNDARLTGSATFVREDLARLTQYINETGLKMHILLVEPESEPKDCLSFFIGSCLLTSESADIGGDGAQTESFGWTAGVPVGSPATTGLDNSLMTICTSAT